MYDNYDEYSMLIHAIFTNFFYYVFAENKKREFNAKGRMCEV